MSQDVKKANQEVMKRLNTILKVQPLPKGLKTLVRSQLQIDADQIEEHLANHSFTEVAWGLKYAQAKSIYDRLKDELGYLESRLNYVIREAEKGNIREEAIKSKVKMHQEYREKVEAVQRAKFLENVLKIVVDSFGQRATMLKSLSFMINQRRERDSMQKKWKEKNDDQQRSREAWGLE